MINLKVLPDKLNIRNTPHADPNYSNWVGELLKGDQFVAETVVRGELYNATDLWYKDNYNRFTTLSELEVDDPNIPWSLRITGVPHIWSVSKGEGVRVAIVDSGIDMKNEDLSNSVVSGYNILTGKSYQNNGEGDPAVLQDNYYHGTACATIVGSRGSKGIIGIAPGSELIVIKISDDGHSSDEVRLQGLRKAVELGADILSISFGNSSPSPSINDFLNQQMAKGIICIAAAGNNPLYTDYPANLKGVISVGNAGCADQNSSMNEAIFHVNNLSATGETTDEYEGVTLIAPGENIVAYNLDGTPVNQFIGTSFSAPFVAGVAAMWLSKHKKEQEHKHFPVNYHKCFRDQIICNCKTQNIIDFAPSRCGAGIINPMFIL